MPSLPPLSDMSLAARTVIPDSEPILAENLDSPLAQTRTSKCESSTRAGVCLVSPFQSYKSMRTGVIHPTYHSHLPPQVPRLSFTRLAERTLHGFLGLLLAHSTLCPKQSVAGPELQTFPGCQWIDEEWADGDSFPVRFPDGAIRTVRLYGVDCLESSVEGSDSNARRLRDQKRWFGIPTMELAHGVGRDGKNETRALLTKPFTVHTAFADARGDNRFARIYGFVTTATGQDLSERLVSKGLARAFGVVRQRPDGTSGEEWREQLKDLEVLAAKKDLGAWSLTNWDQLPAERRAARQEENEIASIKGTGLKAEPASRMDINTASRDQLLTLPGIGEAMALRVVETRPYKRIEDLLKVPGIGPATFTKIAPFVFVAPIPK